MVNKEVLHSQEVETFYILPTIRRYFALCMKEQGIKQKDIAEMLGVNSATISQYSSNKRGHKVNFSENVVSEIKRSSLKIKDRHSYMRETQHILNYIRNKRITCSVHRLFSSVPKNCNPIEMGCISEAGYSR